MIGPWPSGAKPRRTVPRHGPAGAAGVEDQQLLARDGRQLLEQRLVRDPRVARPGRVVVGRAEHEDAFRRPVGPLFLVVVAVPRQEQDAQVVRPGLSGEGVKGVEDRLARRLLVVEQEGQVRGAVPLLLLEGARQRLGVIDGELKIAQGALARRRLGRLVVIDAHDHADQRGAAGAGRRR